VIPFQREGDRSEGYASDGGGDQQQQAELNDRASLKGGDPIDHRRYALQGFRFPVEGGVVDRLVAMTRQVEHSADQDHGGSQQHSGAQQGADDDLDAQVRPLFWSHRRPVTPLKIISKPSTTITAANRYRRTFTFAFTSTLAPIREPASTPSITGMAIPGAI